MDKSGSKPRDINPSKVKRRRDLSARKEEMYTLNGGASRVIFARMAHTHRIAQTRRENFDGHIRIGQSPTIWTVILNLSPVY